MIGPTFVIQYQNTSGVELLETILRKGRASQKASVLSERNLIGVNSNTEIKLGRMDMIEKGMDTHDEEAAAMCTMKFIGLSSGKFVQITIFLPVIEPDTGNWYCLNKIDDNNGQIREKSYGGCAFDAIMLSMERFRVYFIKQDEEFVSADEWQAPALTVFPRTVPWTYGRDVYQRLVNYIDREIEKIENKLTLRREKRGRDKL